MKYRVGDYLRLGTKFVFERLQGGGRGSILGRSKGGSRGEEARGDGELHDCLVTFEFNRGSNYVLCKKRGKDDTQSSVRTFARQVLGTGIFDLNSKIEVETIFKDRDRYDLQRELGS